MEKETTGIREMDIEIIKIKEILIELFDDLKLWQKDTISLDKDYYWDIPSEKLYDPYNDPTDLVIGQLSEDYNMLMNSKDGGCLTCYDLKKISSLLRYIAEEKCY